MSGDDIADAQIAYDQAVAAYGSDSSQAIEAAQSASGVLIDNYPTNLVGPTGHVYGAINAVMADLAASGIGKDRRNQQQNFMFRGVDDIYNALSRLLSKHRLCVLPRHILRSAEERTAKSGGSLMFVVVEAEFDLVSAVDGSRHVIRTFGEAMDSGDKATNKAMSAAYKYAMVQAFCIPTEGDNDADATTHEVDSQVLNNALRAIGNSATLEVLKAHYQTAFLMLPASQRAQLEAAKDKRKKELEPS